MEIFSALLSLCAGNSPVTGEFPTQRPVTQSCDVFFDLCLNKRLRKQTRRWWFEMPLHSLWRLCNVLFPVKVDLAGGEYVIREGGLNGDYRAVQFHWHWGENDSVGAEHIIDGAASPMEVSFFGSMDAALYILIIPPLQRSWSRVYWFHQWPCPSVHPSVRPSVRPSDSLWTESCPLCIIYNTHWIHFIFTHLIKQLQKVCCM